MTPPVVLDYLRDIGRQWTGHGVAVELGSWLGATAVALLEGLVEVGYNRPFYCFDKWMANDEQVRKAQAAGVEIQYRQDLLPLFLENVKPVYNNIVPIKGRIPDKLRQYSGEPIEILLFDAPKREPVFTRAVNALRPFWIDGMVWGLMDYNFWQSRETDLEQEIYQAPVRWMNKHKGEFELMSDWSEESSSVFYRYIKK
ncbi:MAG: hypothetical protein A2Y71_06245 [Bacteroidetes bacterium RBG_13_42_15]|nr:MAG: hypothetical protein A2Y71_06245 [Bacteroidetes bacterium RBG_13_42_15]